ncbi:MAG: ABC transporter permease [Methanomassiliicoccales archaeon]|jgi:peptide/nickel transport system permease protein
MFNKKKKTPSLKAQPVKVPNTKSSSDSLFDLGSMQNEIAPRIREFRSSLYLMRTNVTAMVGLVLVIFIFGLALLAPILAPPVPNADPYTMPKDFHDPQPPLIDGHPLGTGKYGADLYYGIVWGARITLYESFTVVLTAAFIGVVLGAIAGYYGGKIDDLIMRITDVFLSLPSLIMAMAVTSVLSRNLENIMLALIIVWWPGYARLVRAQVLSVRENTYVEAARAVGAKRNRILFKHIVPNSLSPMIVSITMDLGAVCLTAAALSYIGFGVSSGYAEWGRMVSDGQQYFLSTVYYHGTAFTPWWVVAFPGLMILMFTMGCSLIGDALRDILDPRMRR